MGNEVEPLFPGFDAAAAGKFVIFFVEYAQFVGYAQSCQGCMQLHALFVRTTVIGVGVDN